MSKFISYPFLAVEPEKLFILQPTIFDNNPYNNRFIFFLSNVTNINNFSFKIYDAHGTCSDFELVKGNRPS